MDRPLGSNVYRDELRETTPENISRFLGLIDGWLPRAGVRLTGGEPTCVAEAIPDISKRVRNYHNRFLDIVTNGFRLMELDPFLFDFIHLDDHGVNRDLIEKCTEYLVEHGYKDFRIMRFDYHRDLELQRRGNVSNGLTCKDWMGSITLWEKTVYPCCVMHSIEGFENDPRIGESLRKAGWTIDNLELLNTLRDWKNTVPAEVVRACVLGCWHGGTNIEWGKIA
jgi:hypothetical protein